MFHELSTSLGESGANREIWRLSSNSSQRRENELIAFDENYCISRNRRSIEATPKTSCRRGRFLTQLLLRMVKKMQKKQDLLVLLAEFAEQVGGGLIVDAADQKRQFVACVAARRVG